MAATTAKENLMCLAFAYFMDTKPTGRNEEDHYKVWEQIFNNFNVTEVKSKYKSYLEHGFDYASLKTSYSFTKKTPNAHVIVAYKQIKKLYQSNIISRSKS